MGTGSLSGIQVFWGDWAWESCGNIKNKNLKIVN